MRTLFFNTPCTKVRTKLPPPLMKLGGGAGRMVDDYE